MRTVIAQSRERYVRSARLVGRGNGATLYAIAWEGTGERVLAWEVGADGEVRGEPRELARAEAIPAFDVLAEGVAVVDDPASEDRATDGTWSVRVEREGAVSSVWLDGGGRAPVLVWSERGFAAAPAVAGAKDGVWVAFHHDVREDTGEPDVLKWIALRFVDGAGRVSEPSAPMVGRNRDQEGEEQGFEFPSLVVAEDGALTIHGRGSHRFWRQDLSADGFTERVPLGDGAWGCRGRRVSVVTLADGALLTARREKEGIVLARVAMDRVQSDTTRRPALQPVTPRRVAWNPVHGDTPVRHRAADGRPVLFGDLHQHSAHSDGTGTAAERYVRAREEYRDDFAALSDHESFLGKRIGPGEWRWLERVAEGHDDPGAFATLFAYEWTGRMFPGPGHKCVYWPRPGMPVFSRDDVTEGAALVARVHALGGICVPHHTGWTGADAPAHDPEAQPVWEICSCHGCYETPDHPLGQRGELRDQTAVPMLARGLRFGFVACSDGHGLLWHHGVGRKRDPFRSGLTGVQATACTREAIFEAVRTRRCFATSGAKMAIDLHAGPHAMGSTVRSTGSVRVRATVHGTTHVKKLMLIAPGGIAAEAQPADERGTLELDVAPGTWVYARAEQADGEMAWSSPIWVDRG